MNLLLPCIPNPQVSQFHSALVASLSPRRFLSLHQLKVMGLFHNNDGSSSNHTCPNVSVTDPGKINSNLKSHAPLTFLSPGTVRGKPELSSFHRHRFWCLYGILVFGIILPNLQTCHTLLPPKRAETVRPTRI